MRPTGFPTNLAVLGRNAFGSIQAQIKQASDGALVSVVKFDKKFSPRVFVSFVDSNGSGGGEVGVISVNGVAGTGRNEIAVLGEHENGKQRVDVMDLLTGNKVINIPVP